jgi:hypothetical protein
MRRLKREKQPVPPALLTASIKLLSVTGSTDPERAKKRVERLAEVAREYNAGGGATGLTTARSTSLASSPRTDLIETLAPLTALEPATAAL